VICTENIEHILNDRKLVKDIAGCLNQKGKLLLTTPNIDFKAITKDDDAPLQTVELGGHVKRGYSRSELEALCSYANLKVIEIGFVSGFFSQRVTRLWRQLNRINPILSFVLTFPLRLLPVIFDRFIPYTGFSITLVAEKE
jgi:2-polyprenyl-3-methyl-5-hydroxy-6-metoxy-1,4-benzoquinol methylase